MRPEGQSLYESFANKQRLLLEKQSELKDAERELLEEEQKRQRCNLLKITLIVVSLMMSILTTKLAFGLKGDHFPARTKASLAVIISLLSTISIIVFIISFMYPYTGTKDIEDVRTTFFRRVSEHEITITSLQSEFRYFLQQFQ